MMEQCEHEWEYFLAIASNTGADRLRYCMICRTAEPLFDEEETNND